MGKNSGMPVTYRRSSHWCVGRLTGILRVLLPSFVSFHLRGFIAQIVSFFSLSERTIGWLVVSLTFLMIVLKTSDDDVLVRPMEPWFSSLRSKMPRSCLRPALIACLGSLWPHSLLLLLCWQNLMLSSYYHRITISALLPVLSLLH